MVNFLSTLELRHLIEQSLLPTRCVCQVSSAETPSLTIKVYDVESGSIDLLVTGIGLNTLNSGRAIADLIAELRYELKSKRAAKYNKSLFNK